MRLAKLQWLILFLTLLVPWQIRANEVATDTTDCTNKSDCGLPGEDQLVLMGSLLLSIKDLPKGFGQAGMGIPADLVAAAFGLGEDNRKFSLGGLLDAAALSPFEMVTPHYYSYRLQRTMIPRLETVLAKAKVGMSDLMASSWPSPALIVENIPGIGPRIYDADQIRALVSTKLFPYHMRVEWKRDEGVLVPDIQLDRRMGSFVRECLAEAIKNKGCKTAKSKYTAQGMPHSNPISLGGASNFMFDTPSLRHPPVYL